MADTETPAESAKNDILRAEEWYQRAMDGIARQLWHEAADAQFMAGEYIQRAVKTLSAGGQ